MKERSREQFSLVHSLLASLYLLISMLSVICVLFSCISLFIVVCIELYWVDREEIEDYILGGRDKSCDEMRGCESKYGD